VTERVEEQLFRGTSQARSVAPGISNSVTRYTFIIAQHKKICFDLRASYTSTASATLLAIVRDR